MGADLLLPSAVPCWSIPPSQCIKSTRLGRAPIRGVSGRRGVPLAVSQLAAAADSPPGYLARGRKPRGTVILQPSSDAVSLQQLLAVEQQLQPDDVLQQQQQQAGPGFDSHPGSALVMQELLQHSLPGDDQEHELPAAAHAQLSFAEHTQEQLQWQAQTELVLQAAHPAELQQQQQQLQPHLQQQQQHAALQQQRAPVVQQQPRAQSRQQLQQQLPQQQHQPAERHPQQQQQHPQQLQPQQGPALNQQQVQQAWHQNGSRHQQQNQQQQRRLQGQAWQANGHSQQAQQRQQQQLPEWVHQKQRQQQQQGQGPGYIRGPSSYQVQQPQQGIQPLQQWHTHPQGQQQQQQLQQRSPSTSSARSSSSSGGSSGVASTSNPSTPSSNSSNSNRRGSRSSSAYSVIPATTAPSVAEASAAAAAAAAAAVAAAARSRARQGRGGGTAAAAAAAAAGVQPLLPPAEECVPQAFWGLMNEELRPWHRENLVHLCYVLPPPACYIYRDMKPSRMQRVLAQRAILEKALRGHLVELVHQEQQLQRWLKTLQARQPRVDKSINPDSVLQAQQELQNLKAALGRSRYSLQTLQDRAAAYSDRDYVQYSQSFDRLLSELEAVAEIQRSHAAPTVLQLQQLHDAAARRVLFARTEEAVAALHRESSARFQILLKSEQGLLDSSKQRLDQLRKEMQGFAWRYPPAPYIAWQFKGALKGARSPWSRTPGVGRKEPRVRQRGQQLQQPGTPPPLLGP